MSQIYWLYLASSQGKTEDYYYTTLSYANVHGSKLPPLEELLGVDSNDGGSYEFGDAYEKQALKRLEEMNGRQRTADQNKR